MGANRGLDAQSPRRKRWMLDVRARSRVPCRTNALSIPHGNTAARQKLKKLTGARKRRACGLIRCNAKGTLTCRLDMFPTVVEIRLPASGGFTRWCMVVVSSCREGCWVKSRNERNLAPVLPADYAGNSRGPPRLTREEGGDDVRSSYLPVEASRMLQWRYNGDATRRRGRIENRSQFEIAVCNSTA